MPFDSQTNNQDLSESIFIGERLEAMSAIPSKLYRNVFKRLFDIAFVLIAAPVVLTVIAIAAFAVWLEGGSPFYGQMRVGKNGRKFKIWKIRTMVRNADEVFEDYLAKNPDAKREWETNQKVVDDVRITRIGRYLRKTSLDELPQFWNALVGDMSIVGPRPMMVEQQKLYPGTAYYKFRPGITGPWQVSDRHESTFIARAKFDADYDRKVSFFTDLKLIVSTVLVVVRCTGR